MGTSLVCNFWTWIRRSVFRPQVVGHSSHWKTGFSPTEWIILWAFNEFDWVKRALQMSPKEEIAIRITSLTLTKRLTYIDKVSRQCESWDVASTWTCQVMRRCSEDIGKAVHLKHQNLLSAVQWIFDEIFSPVWHRMWRFSLLSSTLA